MWDTTAGLGSKKAKRNSLRNKCEANHRSWIRPTHKLPPPAEEESMTVLVDNKLNVQSTTQQNEELRQVKNVICIDTETEKAHETETFHTCIKELSPRNIKKFYYTTVIFYIKN